jgi:hypothetical protein
MAEITSNSPEADRMAYAQRLFTAGQLTARYGADLGGVTQLLDRHVASWPNAQSLTPFVMNGLEARASLAAAISDITRAVSLVPHGVDWQRTLASILEYNGQLERALLIRQLLETVQPDTVENRAAIARLREAKGEATSIASWRSDRPIESTGAVLAWSRYIATAPAHKRDAHQIEEARLAIRDKLLSKPKDVALHLALGFLGLAESDPDSARKHFAEASLLARDQRSGVEEYDPWSLAYAEAFLLNRTKGNRIPLNPIDRLQLGLLHARTLHDKGSLFSALAVYGDTISNLVPSTMPNSYQIYKGHAIVQHQGRYYAVPRDVPHFAITNGVVMRRLGFQPPGSVRSPWIFWLFGKLNPNTRERLKQIAKRSRILTFIYGRLVRSQNAVQNRIVDPLLKMLDRIVYYFYLRRYAAAGVLTDADIVALQNRIDKSRRRGITLPENRPCRRQTIRSPLVL